MPVTEVLFAELVGPRDAVEQGNGYRQVTFQGSGLPPTRWVEPGWTFLSKERTKLHTFVRAIKKKKQTFKLAGLMTTPKARRLRWKKNKWLFSTYHYR